MSSIRSRKRDSGNVKNHVMNEQSYVCPLIGEKQTKQTKKTTKNEETIVSVTSSNLKLSQNNSSNRSEAAICWATGTPESMPSQMEKRKR